MQGWKLFKRAVDVGLVFIFIFGVSFFLDELFFFFGCLGDMIEFGFNLID